jgi:hypothetical protein
LAGVGGRLNCHSVREGILPSETDRVSKNLTTLTTTRHSTYNFLYGTWLETIWHCNEDAEWTRKVSFRDVELELCEVRAQIRPHCGCNTTGQCNMHELLVVVTYTAVQQEWIVVVPSYVGINLAGRRTANV